MKINDHSVVFDFLPLVFLAMVFLVVAAAAAFAHDPGLSAVELKLHDQQLVAHLSFARPEIASLLPLDADRDGQIAQSEVDAVRDQLESIGRSALVVNS